MKKESLMSIYSSKEAKTRPSPTFGDRDPVAVRLDCPVRHALVILCKQNLGLEKISLLVEARRHTVDGRRMGRIKARRIGCKLRTVLFLICELEGKGMLREVF